MQQHNKETHTKNTASPLVYTITMAVTRNCHSHSNWFTTHAEGRVAKPERQWGCHRGTSRDEIIVFCEQQLQNQQPWDDYQEVMQLVLIFIGRKQLQLQGVTLQAPVPMHQACWMAKAIYSLKIWLTVLESQGLLTSTYSSLRSTSSFGSWPQ